MVTYRCFFCRKEIPDEMIQKRVRCPYCGSKILIKQRLVPTKVKAR